MIRSGISFEEIVLSKKELWALKRLCHIADEHCEVQVIWEEVPILKRLAHWEFVEFYPNRMELPDVYGGTLPEKVRIVDRGRDYLAYLKERKRDKTNNRRYEIIRTLLDALAGALAALLVEHFEEIVNFGMS